MEKETLWQIYVKKNPKFATTENITINARGLRKLFETTYDKAHDQGFRNGKAFKDMRESTKDKANSYVDELFSGVFGNKQ